LYGCEQPPIIRHVVCEGENNKFKRIEIYPLHLQVQHLQNKVPSGELTDICISKKTTIEETKKIIRQLLRLTKVCDKFFLLTR
jgi:hypothetical protein